MRYLRLTLDLPELLRHPLESFRRESDAIERAELLTWNTSPEGVEYALFYIEGDVERYRERIEEVAPIREYNLTAVDGSSFYSYVCHETREADDRWRAAFGRRNLVVVPPIAYAGVGMTLTIVGAGEDLRGLVEDLPEPVGVTVEEVGDYDRRHARVAGALTDRQFEAVEVAADLGYYAVPREASLADVAAELDCAESTASTLLRRAEGAVMRRIAGRP